MRKVSKQDLERLLESGAEIEMLPSALEEMIAGLREDIKTEAQARRESESELRQMFATTIEKIATNRQDIDIEGLLTRMAAIMSKSHERPSYEFEIHRDGMGTAEKIVARPEKVLN